MHLDRRSLGCLIIVPCAYGDMGCGSDRIFAFVNSFIVETEVRRGVAMFRSIAEA